MQLDPELMQIAMAQVDRDKPISPRFGTHYPYNCHMLGC